MSLTPDELDAAAKWLANHESKAVSSAAAAISALRTAAADLRRDAEIQRLTDKGHLTCIPSSTLPSA